MFSKLNFALMTLTILSIVIFSCSKDHLEPSSNLDTDTELNTRSSVALEVSYDLEKVSLVEPDQGEFKDMCMGDIRMLQELTRLYSITSTITETGNPCIEVIKKRKVLVSGYDNTNQNGDDGGGSSDGYEYESTSKYCNRILTYITRDTTITRSVTVNFEFWKQVIQGYLYTETEVKEHFETMIETLAQNGAIVTQDNHTVSVTETSATGEEITSVYNKHTNLLMYTELKDSSGNIKKTFAYEYTCSPDGEIVPKSILIKTTDTSTICKTPYTKKEWMMFDNYNVSIQ